jgi:hypothetical protein
LFKGIVETKIENVIETVVIVTETEIVEGQTEVVMTEAIAKENHTLKNRQRR